MDERNIDRQERIAEALHYGGSVSYGAARFIYAGASLLLLIGSIYYFTNPMQNTEGLSALVFPGMLSFLSLSFAAGSWFANQMYQRLKD